MCASAVVSTGVCMGDIRIGMASDTGKARDLESGDTDGFIWEELMHDSL